MQACATCEVEQNLDITLALVDASRAGAAVVPEALAFIGLEDSCGHGLVVDPSGDIVAKGEGGDGFALADIDPGRVAEVRGQPPSLANRGEIR